MYCADGPLALLPSEIEIYDAERMIFEAELDRKAWLLQQVCAAGGKKKRCLLMR